MKLSLVGSVRQFCLIFACVILFIRLVQTYEN